MNALPNADTVLVGKRLSDWLRSELEHLPGDIKAVYVEWDTTADLRSTEPVECFDAFGFLSQAGDRADFEFDFETTSCRFDLGEFHWEGSRPAEFRRGDFPAADWLSALGSAAASPDVLPVARARGVQLIVGEHDGEVVIVA